MYKKKPFFWDDAVFSFGLAASSTNKKIQKRFLLFCRLPLRSKSIRLRRFSLRLDIFFLLCLWIFKVKVSVC